MVVCDFDYSGALAFNYQDAAASSAGHLYPPQPTSFTVAAASWPNAIGHRHHRPSMKRELSDTDPDDVFDDGSGKGTPTQSSNSCQMLNRKKRRGIIEKKRRDRINNSLTELRRLVPTAFEKQGSAKLEKAEILQMTVDHLKMLHAKGFDAFSFDPHKFAMDYHSIGFRECASEVARYLVTVEGLDIQDPLRLRLMSHLQCFSTQRDLAVKPSPAPTHPTSWNTFSPVQTGLNSSQFNTSSAAASTMPPPQHNLQMSTATLETICNPDVNRFQDGNSSSSNLGHHMRLPPPPPPPNHHHHQSMTISGGGSSPTYQGNQPTTILPHHHHPLPSQYPTHLSINSHTGFTSMSPTAYSPTSSSTTSTTQVKPYRPWGTELAY